MVNPAVDACLSGEISAPVALARMLLGGADAAGIAAQLAAAKPADPARLARWHALDQARAARPAALDGLAAQIAAAGSANQAAIPGGIAGIAALFDRAAAHSPEAGVALYSLGDPAVLAAATAEIVHWLNAAGFVGGDVLDLGCGFGRITAALAPLCRSVLGIDVSAAMIAEARARWAAIPNARFQVTSGHDLDWLAPASLDLILAVDSFPYLVQAGVADAHAAGAARALRPGGHLVILNLSYGRTPADDATDADRWAADMMDLHLRGARPFTIWDGTAFVFLRRD